MNNTNPVMDKALLTLENPEDIEKYFNDQARFHFAKLTAETIDDFNGDFGFLNNEYDCEVYYEGLLYSNVYSAFQASRTSNEFIRGEISKSKSSYEVYNLSQQIEDPKDWHSRRLKVMEMLIRDKFTRHEDLKQELIATGSRILVNSYGHDTPSNLFWGKVKNKGTNYLGVILMNIRDEILRNQNLLIWLHTNLQLPIVKQLYPEFQIKVSVDDQIIRIDRLNDKSYYFIGSSKNDDLIIPSEELDKKMVVLAFDTVKGLVIVKTSRDSNLKIKGQEIPYLIPSNIKNKSSILLANKYSLNINCQIQKIQDYLIKRQNDMEHEITNLKTQAKNPNLNEVVMASYGLAEKKTLFISGFKSISDNELRSIFGVFGDIDEIKIPVDKYSGKNRNIAFVKFRDSSAANLAIKTPLYHNSKKLIVKFAESSRLEHKRKSNLDKRKEKSKKQRSRLKSYSDRSSISNSSSKSNTSQTSFSSITSNSPFSDESSLSSSRSSVSRIEKRTENAKTL